MRRISGILVFSFLIILAGAVLPGREVELQFHRVNEEYNPSLKQLQKAGFSKMIIRSFLNNGDRGGLLFTNSVFKTAYPGFTRILEKNKKRSFSLWGWLIARKYDWLATSELYDSEFIRGKRKRIKKLDIFRPEVREKVIAAFRELAKSGVEGILIQDDLAFASGEGFSDAGISTFAREAGVPAREKLMMRSGTPYNLKWISIKNRVLKGFLADIVRSCKTVNPELELGLNVYYESAIHRGRGNEWHSQDLREIASTEIDRIYLMMYHRQMKYELKLSRGKIKALFKEGIEEAWKIAGDRLVVKLEIWDWKKGEIIPIEEMMEYIAMIPSGVKRICFTPVKSADLRYLKSLLRASELKTGPRKDTMEGL